jgi:hypothetical protein
VENSGERWLSTYRLVYILYDQKDQLYMNGVFNKS